eukprot:ctg_285.g195
MRGEGACVGVGAYGTAEHGMTLTGGRGHEVGDMAWENALGCASVQQRGPGTDGRRCRALPGVQPRRSGTSGGAVSGVPTRAGDGSETAGGCSQSGGCGLCAGDGAGGGHAGRIRDSASARLYGGGAERVRAGRDVRSIASTTETATALAEPSHEQRCSSVTAPQRLPAAVLLCGASTAGQVPRVARHWLCAGDSASVHPLPQTLRGGATVVHRTLHARRLVSHGRRRLVAGDIVPGGQLCVDCVPLGSEFGAVAAVGAPAATRHDRRAYRGAGHALAAPTQRHRHIVGAGHSAARRCMPRFGCITVAAFGGMRSAQRHASAGGAVVRCGAGGLARGAGRLDGGRATHPAIVVRPSGYRCDSISGATGRGARTAPNGVAGGARRSDGLARAPVHPERPAAMAHRDGGRHGWSSDGSERE